MKFDFNLNIDSTASDILVVVIIAYAAYRLLMWCFK